MLLAKLFLTRAEIKIITAHKEKKMMNELRAVTEKVQQKHLTKINKYKALITY